MFTGNYVCQRCGKVFEEPREREYREAREFWGMVCYETFVEQTCPKCGCDDFTEEWIDEAEEEEYDRC